MDGRFCFNKSKEAIMEDGLYYGELSDFKNKLGESVEKLFPKETKNFLRNEAKKQSKIQKQVAKQKVGTKSNSDKSYHKKFKIGKIFEEEQNSKNIRAYNSSPHGHLIENGHFQVPRGNKGASNEGGSSNGWTNGKHVIETAQIMFKEEYYKDCDEFLAQSLNKACRL